MLEVHTFAWFPYSLGSILFLSISMVFYKSPAMKGENPRVVNFYQTATGLALTLLFFHSYLSATDRITLLWSAAWGIGFAILALLQMYALYHVDTNSLFPPLVFNAKDLFQGISFPP